MDDIEMDAQYLVVIGMACVFAALALYSFIQDCKISREFNRVLDQIDKENQKL